MAGMGTGGYAVGYHAIAHCKRCGDLVLRRHLIPDGHFPDLLVCVDCWDPKHPQDYLPDIHDPETIYKPTGDLDRVAANTTVISFPPWKFIYGVDMSTSVFPWGQTQTRPRLESPVKSGSAPGPMLPAFKQPGLLTLELDNNDKFTIAGGGVTDA